MEGPLPLGKMLGSGYKRINGGQPMTLVLHKVDTWATESSPDAEACDVRKRTISLQAQPSETIVLLTTPSYPFFWPDAIICEVHWP